MPRTGLGGSWSQEGVAEMTLVPQAPLEAGTGDRVVPREALLTPREQDVLALVALGMSNREIAAKLSIGVGTVKTHLSSIFWKLGVSNRTQAGLVGLGMSMQGAAS